MHKIWSKGVLLIVFVWITYIAVPMYYHFWRSEVMSQDLVRWMMVWSAGGLVISAILILIEISRKEDLTNLRKDIDTNLKVFEKNMCQKGIRLTIGNDLYRSWLHLRSEVQMSITKREHLLLFGFDKNFRKFNDRYQTLMAQL